MRGLRGVGTACASWSQLFSQSPHSGHEAQVGPDAMVSPSVRGTGFEVGALNPAQLIVVSADPLAA